MRTNRKSRSPVESRYMMCDKCYNTCKLHDSAALVFDRNLSSPNLLKVNVAFLNPPSHLSHLFFESFMTLRSGKLRAAAPCNSSPRTGLTWTRRLRSGRRPTRRRACCTRFYFLRVPCTPAEDDTRTRLPCCPNPASSSPCASRTAA